MREDPMFMVVPLSSVTLSAFMVTFELVTVTLPCGFWSIRQSHTTQLHVTVCFLASSVLSLCTTLVQACQRDDGLEGQSIYHLTICHLPFVRSWGYREAQSPSCPSEPSCHQDCTGRPSEPADRHAGRRHKGSLPVPLREDGCSPASCR